MKNNNIELTTDYLEKLAKLSGIIYYQYYYNSEYWKKLTGENPLNHPNSININTNGKCAINAHGRKLLNLYFLNNSRNFQAIGILTN